MEIHTFGLKLIYGNGIYLPLADCVEISGLPREAFTGKEEIRDIDDLPVPAAGERLPVLIRHCGCVYIAEDRYNDIIQKEGADPEVNIQYTKVNSLSGHLLDLVRLYPLKLAFARNLFAEKARENRMGVEEYILRVDLPEEIQKQIKAIQASRDFSDDIRKYEKDLERMQEEMAKSVLDCEVKSFTIINKGKADILTFLVGDGFFYEVYPDMSEDFWEETEWEDGVLKVPSASYDGFLRLKPYRCADWDFREHTVSDSIRYCLENIPSEDAGMDLVEISDGGVLLYLYKEILMKLINPSSSPDIFFVEGVPDFEENVWETKGGDTGK